MKYNITYRRNEVVTVEVPNEINNTAQLAGLERELNAKIDQPNGPSVEVISWEVVPEAAELPKEETNEDS